MNEVEMLGAVRTVYVNVAAGVGNHGDFLQTFALTVCRADAENYLILLPAAVALAQKYDLFRPPYTEAR